MLVKGGMLIFFSLLFIFLQNFTKGETIAFMSHAKPSSVIRYSTVQVSEHDHIELNSE